jgi:hypothetical protein
MARIAGTKRSYVPGRDETVAAAGLSAPALHLASVLQAQVLAEILRPTPSVGRRTAAGLYAAAAAHT